MAGASDNESQHLFVEHVEDTRRNLSQSVSHARRVQIARQRRQQLENATQAAGYARGLVGWQTSRPIHSARTATREFIFRVQHHSSETQSEQRSAYATLIPTIQNPTDNGIRADPFNSFPDNSREVMHTIDFYINIWSPYKRGAIDLFLGLNTQVDICWPIALQDDMLFDATLAVSRIAYCLCSHAPVDDDTFALRYKLQALSKLRQKIGSQEPYTESTIFTVTRMLSVSYLTCDNPAFQIHFAALSEIVPRYLGHHLSEDWNAGNQVDSLIMSRIRSWTPLLEYRKSQTGLNQRSLQLDHNMPIITRLPSTISDDLRTAISGLPLGFAHLARNGAFSMQTLSCIIQLYQILEHLQTSTMLELVTEQYVYTVKQGLVDLIASPGMDLFEQQVCHALLALAVALLGVYNISGVALSNPVEMPLITQSLSLERLARAFLNLRLAGKLLSPLHSLCLQWCALAVGCCCFMVPGSTESVRAKGHIVLISIPEQLTPCLACNEWQPFERDLGSRFFWYDRIVMRWRELYSAAIHRQREWELAGLLRLGVPANDKIEYMVLRDARGNLPTIGPNPTGAP